MADTVRCENGHENEAGVAFCAYCGKPIQTTKPDAAPDSGATVTNEFGIEGLGPLVPVARGGQSIVYRAENPRLDRTVAVKVLTGVLDDTARGRFDRECKAMGALSDHPGIVSVFDAGFTSDGSPYLVMEFMKGGSLADILLREGRMKWTEAFKIGVAICGALQAAHDSGVIHGDVKPENLLRSAHGETKLTDFGVASLITRGTTGGASRVGLTVAHAPPEVLMGQQPTRAADIYALGSTLFTLVAGRPAFQMPDDAPGMVIQRVLNTTMPDLRRNGIPDRVCAELEHAMAKDPATRFPSATAMGDALEGVVRELGSGDETHFVDPVPPPVPIAPAAPAPAPEPPRKPKRAVLLGSVVGLMLLVAGAIGGAKLLGPDPDPSPGPTTTAAPPPSTATTASSVTTTSTSTTSTTSAPTTTAAPVLPLEDIGAGNFSGTATGIPGFATVTVALRLTDPLSPTDQPDSGQELRISFVELNDCTEQVFGFHGVSSVTGTYRFDSFSAPCEQLSPNGLELSGTTNSITANISADEGDVVIHADRVT